MNEVSIILDGVRYDMVESERPFSCKGCEKPIAESCGLCTMRTIFKKSTKSFER